MNLLRFCLQEIAETVHSKQQGIVHVVFGSLARLCKPHALDLTIANTWIRPSS